MIWPYKPLTPMQETLAWLTDVIQSYEGEQRIALRSVPRRTFNFDHLLNPEMAFGARVKFRELQDYLIPDWTQTDTVSLSTGTSIVVSVTSPYYEVGAAAIVWANYDDYEQVEIEAVNSDGTITLVEVVGNYTDAIIMPLYEGLSLAQFSAAISAGGFIRAGFQGISFYSADISASDYPQYLNHDVMVWCPNVASGSLDGFIAWPYEVVDNDTGRAQASKQRVLPDDVFFVRWQAFSQLDQLELRQWLYSRRGRQKAFWLPSWLNDLPLQQPIGSAATIITTSLPSAEVALLTTVHLEIKAGADKYWREVINLNVTGGGLLEITLDSALGVDLALADVDRISIMRCVRFNVDSIDLQHAAAAGFSVSIPTIEVPIPDELSS